MQEIPFWYQARLVRQAASWGQLAKIAGCRAVGIAGGPDKCKWLVEEAGYDAAIDYKAGNVKQQIKELCPRGVDVIYDNVGGTILNDMLACIATGARVVICGGIRPVIDAATDTFRCVFEVDNRDLSLPSGFAVRLREPANKARPSSQ